MPVLPIGALAFFIGSILLGVATMRAPGMDRWAGILLVAGFVTWTVAFFAPAGLAWLLTIANLVGGAGLVRIGLTAWMGPMRARAHA